MTSTFPSCEPPSFGSRPSQDGLEQRFWNQPPEYDATEPPAPPEVPARVVSPERARLAKALFMTMFGGMAALLVYSLVVRIAQG